MLGFGDHCGVAETEPWIYEREFYDMYWIASHCGHRRAGECKILWAVKLIVSCLDVVHKHAKFCVLTYDWRKRDLICLTGCYWFAHWKKISWQFWRFIPEQVHELTGDKLKIRDVVHVDIANDPIAPADYREPEDPTKWVSTIANSSECSPQTSFQIQINENWSRSFDRPRLEKEGSASDDMLQARHMWI